MSTNAFAQIAREQLEDEAYRDDVRQEREEGRLRDAQVARTIAGARAVGILSALLRGGEIPQHSIAAATEIVRAFDHAYDA